jgi:hypothetical protein
VDGMTAKNVRAIVILGTLTGGWMFTVTFVLEDFFYAAIPVKTSAISGWRVVYDDLSFASRD